MVTLKPYVRKMLIALQDSSTLANLFLTKIIENRNPQEMGWVKYRNNNIWVDKNEYVGQQLSGGNPYEPQVAEAIEQHTEPGDVCFDVGCQWGIFSLLMAEIVEDSGQVYAFDPIPYHINALHKSAEQNYFSNVSGYQVAVTDEMGETKVYPHATNTGASSLHRDSVSQGLPLIVPTITLESFCERNRINSPDLIKIDVEGAELQVLKGALPVLSPETTVLMEIHPTNLNNKEVNELFSLMDSRGDLKDISKSPVNNITSIENKEHLLWYPRDDLS